MRTPAINMWFVAAAVNLTACSAMPPEKEAIVATSKERVDEAAIVKRVGLDLPADATIEFSERIDGRDEAARLIVVMSDGDWQALISDLAPSGSDQPPFSSDANFHLGPDEGGWEPSLAKGLKTMQIPWKNGREALNLGVESTQAGHVRLFVFWHEI